MLAERAGAAACLHLRFLSPGQRGLCSRVESVDWSSCAAAELGGMGVGRRSSVAFCCFSVAAGALSAALWHWLCLWGLGGEHAPSTFREGVWGTAPSTFTECPEQGSKGAGTVRARSLTLHLPLGMLQTPSEGALGGDHAPSTSGCASAFGLCAVLLCAEFVPCSLTRVSRGSCVALGCPRSCRWQCLCCMVAPGGRAGC